MSTLRRPLLVYDGDCAFCRYAVEYGRTLTGERVEYQPYQRVQEAFPALTEAEFRESIRLVRPDGAVSSGAAAAFEMLSLAGYNRLWARAYARLPLFAVLSEWVYRQVAAHRDSCYRLCRLLFGHSLQSSSAGLTSWLFLRLLALIYLAAFASFTVQAPGLIGSQGILPAVEFFNAVDLGYGPEKYRLLPSLFWLNDADAAIRAVGLAGCLLALILLLDRLPRLCLIGLYVCYLSLFHAGQVFMSFQWDILLLECGFLAMFLPSSPLLFTWLYRWLLFRFMLQSGLVKLLSGDIAWRELAALDYHFHTQPLPTVLAWYADKLPAAILRTGVVLTFVVELLVPFLILMPRRPRKLAALAIALFQLSIIATGNYNYFNLLTLCLCLLLLDDQRLATRCPGALRRRAALSGKRRMPGSRVLCALVAGVYLTLSVILLSATGNRASPVGVAGQLVAWAEPFHIANGYGLFAVMTTTRKEIIFEGSSDGREWLAYELPYKPGAMDRMPGWAAPHQPRLDWQLWFAALAPRDQSPWLRGLIRGLLTGAEPIADLFAYNPFADAPPKYIRASLYRYEFTDGSSRRHTVHWWRREYLGSFWPVSAWQLPLERVAGRKQISKRHLVMLE